MTDNTPVALITGAGRRIGAQTARVLHAAGYNVVLHYRNSVIHAHALMVELNAIRLNSALALPAELNLLGDIEALAKNACAHWQRLDVLVNNASSFYPTPIGTATAHQWDDLMASNLKAPFFLSQALADELRKRKGCIINIADIHADRPLKDHPIYCAAKAGNIMLTKALARDLAPDIRVNGIAPGAIMWPEQDTNSSPESHDAILQKVPMNRLGDAGDIADTILFLIKKSPYITGQIIAVDGGRSLSN